MNRPAPREHGKRLIQLLEALRDTERQIVELRADPSASPVADRQHASLVRRAKRQRRQSDIATQSAILNALPASVALLDAAGTIIAVNDTWRAYDRAGTDCGPGHAVGLNYLDICDGTKGQSLAERRIPSGIRSVLNTAQSEFSIEYACHLPTTVRWLSLTVVSIDAGLPHGAVVSHVDVTARHAIEESLLASGNRFRQMAENIDDVFFLRDLVGANMLYVNPAYERIWGRSCESLYANPGSFTESIHAEDRAEAIAKINYGDATGRFAAEFRVVRPDGSIRWISAKGFPVRDDSGALVRVAGVAQDITERKEASERVRQSEARYRTLIETSFDAIVVSRDDVILEVNIGFESMFGYSAAEVVGRQLASLFTADVNDSAGTVPARDELNPQSVDGRRKDGRRILLDITARVHTAGGREEVITAMRDVTQRRKLEEQIRQAQKLDAVGRLAAGIAHDFNNQLSVIMAYSSFVYDHLGDGDPARDDMAEIQRAATAAANLTRQLLVFSRQQVIPPRVVALDEIVDDADRMLRHLIGEDIKLVTIHGGEPATTLIDPSHIEQLVMNLVLNARDAMPTGGSLTVETRVVDLDDSVAQADWPTIAGRFAMLAVTDTGSGMDAGTRAKIFEPFFTTKAAGLGTGLGLATVYGIVKQSGGSISVYSEPGFGTCFKVYLPFASGDAAAHERMEHPIETLNGTESILITEDSEPVRRAVRHMLERLGYRVLEAATEARALEFAEGTERIDLLLTDVIMPVISGRILAERIAVIRPGIKVLFMSGYTDDAILRHGILSSDVQYIEKPFTPVGLGRKVRAVLDLEV